MKAAEALDTEPSKTLTAGFYHDRFETSTHFYVRVVLDIGVARHLLEELASRLRQPNHHRRQM